MQQNLTVPALGTILGIWAHPDDEAYLSAALMAEARDAGQRVVVVTATDGELGGDGPVADWRRREAVESLAAVGVTDHRWLGFRDGQCADVEFRGQEQHQFRCDVCPRWRFIRHRHDRCHARLACAVGLERH